jgi:hypothetical protein
MPANVVHQLKAGVPQRQTIPQQESSTDGTNSARLGVFGVASSVTHAAPVRVALPL